MMYQNNFVAVIKSNNKILRENNSVVTIPFGSEYSILLKNLKSVRALAEITIDGESITDKEKLIIPPNSEINIERFIRKGNLTSGNKLKFVERTESIENHRGIKVNDGIIRIEFWSEIITTWIYNTCSNPLPTYKNQPWPGYTMYDSIGMLRSMSMTQLEVESPSVEGITVSGSESNQQFSVGEYFPTENQSTVINFKLVGKINNEDVKTPLLVSTKPKCITCGKLNKSTNKFCSDCGTSLQII